MKKLCCVLAITLLVGLCACRRDSNNYSSSTSPTPTTANTAVVDFSSITEQTASSTPNRALTNSQVETAVSEMLSGYRLSGSVRVSGIQEIPQNNSAVADLQFESFEYPVSFEGGLLKAKDFKVRKPSGAAIPPPEEMFPPKKVVYSKDGRAILSKYTDGRWVLKSVNWGFDTGVKGNVEIR